MNRSSNGFTYRAYISHIYAIHTYTHGLRSRSAAAIQHLQHCNNVRTRTKLYRLNLHNLYHLTSHHDPHHSLPYLVTLPYFTLPLVHSILSFSLTRHTPLLVLLLLLLLLLFQYYHLFCSFSLTKHHTMLTFTSYICVPYTYSLSTLYNIYYTSLTIHLIPHVKDTYSIIHNLASTTSVHRILRYENAPIITPYDTHPHTTCSRYNLLEPVSTMYTSSEHAKRAVPRTPFNSPSTQYSTHQK